MLQRAKERREHMDVEQLCKGSLSNYVYGESEQLEGISAPLSEAVAAEGVTFWEHVASHNEWIPRAIAHSLGSSLPPVDVPCLLLCSAHAPAAPVQDSMRNLHGKMLGSKLVFIPKSKGWWELDNPKFVKKELAELSLQVLAAAKREGSASVQGSSHGSSQCFKREGSVVGQEGDLVSCGGSRLSCVRLAPEPAGARALAPLVPFCPVQEDQDYAFWDELAGTWVAQSSSRNGRCDCCCFQ